MQYRHHFFVRAPQSAVSDFHRHSNSMGAITPPPVIVRVHSAPEVLGEGDQMEFTLWLGPLPLHWLARIEQTTPVSFVDRQLSGPFGAWEHLHTYVEAPVSTASQDWGETGSGATTVVVDQVTAEFSHHWFWKLIGLGMWISLPILFAYRGWKTRRILETSSTIQAPAAA